MNKLTIQIIKDTHTKTVHIALDYGQYHTIKLNAPIEQLIKIIKQPEKYNIELTEL